MTYLVLHGKTDTLEIVIGGEIEPMSLHSQKIPPVPAQTIRVAQAAFPKGNLYMRLRDELGVFYQDEDFDSFYPRKKMNEML